MTLTLISGGAKGADSAFEALSKEHNHKILSYRPDDVKSDQYDVYDNYLKYINENYVHRKYPTRNEYVNNLLRRDVIVSNCDIVYAVTWFEKDGIGELNIHGGTAWAVWCAIDRFIKLADTLPNNNVTFPCYIYDQNVCKWHQVKYNKNNANKIEFIEVNKVPLLKELKEGIKFAGIGTREILPHSVEEIKKLYN